MDSAASTLRGQTLPAGVVSVEGEITDCRHRLAEFVRLLTAALEDRRRIADEWRRWEEGTAAIVLWFETTGETLKTCLCQAGECRPRLPFPPELFFCLAFVVSFAFSSLFLRAYLTN